jgi:Protein of unknown function (DUF1573)
MIANQSNWFRATVVLGLGSLLFSNQVSSRSCLAESEIASKADVFDHLLVSEGSPVKLAVFKLSDIAPGSFRHVTVFLKNKGDKTFTLRNAATSCGCTKAKVPQGEVKAGETVQLDFEIRTKTHPNKLEDDFDITVEADGPFETLRIRLHAKYKDHVTFNRDEYSHVCADSIDSKDEAEFRLPVRATDPKLLEGIKAVATDDLSNVDVRFVRIGESGEVIASYRPSLLGHKDSAGELQLKKEGRTIAAIFCTIQKRPEIQIHPDYMKFVVSKNDNTLYEGTAIVRLLPSKDNSPKELLECTCQATGSKKLDVELIKMSKGIYRINITTKIDPSFPSHGDLAWQLMTTSGLVKRTLKYVSFNN